MARLGSYRGRKQSHRRTEGPDAFGNVEDSPNSATKCTIEDVEYTVAGSWTRDIRQFSGEISRPSKSLWLAEADKPVSDIEKNP
jgi:hypothetical protein